MQLDQQATFLLDVLSQVFNSKSINKRKYNTATAQWYYCFALINLIWWPTVGSEYVEIGGETYFFDMQNHVIKINHCAVSPHNCAILIDGLGNGWMDLPRVPQHDFDQPANSGKEHAHQKFSSWISWLIIYGRN